MEIKSVIRPTQIVRAVMRKAGVETYEMFTNSYEKCRTVKCYARGDLDSIMSNIRQALIKAGVQDFKIHSRPSPYWCAGVDSLIVRIPRTEQP